MKTRFCPSCGKERAASEFSARASSITGRKLTLCNGCWEAKRLARTKEGRAHLKSRSDARRREEKTKWLARVVAGRVEQSAQQRREPDNNKGETGEKDMGV